MTINKSQLVSYYTKVWIPFMLKNKITQKKLAYDPDYAVRPYYDRFSWIVSINFYDAYKRDIDIAIWIWNWGWKADMTDMKATGILALCDYCDQDCNKALEILRKIKTEISKFNTVTPLQTSTSVTYD